MLVLFTGVVDIATPAWLVADADGVHVKTVLAVTGPVFEAHVLFDVFAQPPVKVTVSTVLPELNAIVAGHSAQELAVVYCAPMLTLPMFTVGAALHAVAGAPVVRVRTLGFALLTQTSITVEAPVKPASMELGFIACEKVNTMVSFVSMVPAVVPLVVSIDTAVGALFR